MRITSTSVSRVGLAPRSASHTAYMHADRHARDRYVAATRRQSGTTPDANVNLMRCQSLELLGMNLTDILSSFPQDSYPYRDSHNRATWDQTKFAAAILPSTEWRWYSIRQITDWFGQFDFLNLRNLIVAGCYHGGEPRLIRYYAGKVKSVIALDDQSVEAPRYEAEIEPAVPGSPSVKVIWQADSLHLFGPYTHDYVYVLGEKASDADVFQEAIRRVTFMNHLQTIFGETLTQFDMNVAQAVLNLMLEFPPTFRETAILNTLRGRASRSAVIKARPEYGMIADVKRGGTLRYSDDQLKTWTRLLEAFLTHQGLITTYQPKAKDGTDTAPTWIEQRQIDKPTARLLLTHLIALAAQPNIPPESIATKKPCTVDEKQALAVLMAQAPAVMAALADTYASARQRGWPATLNGDLQLRQSDFIDQRTRRVAKGKGVVSFRFSIQAPELYSDPAAARRKRIYPQLLLSLHADTGAFQSVEIRWTSS